MLYDPLLEPDKNGNLVGKNPLTMSVNELKMAGHEDIALAKIIRKKCIDCCGGVVGEVSKCVVTDCPLWVHRTGKNPFLADKRKGKGGFA